MRDQPNSDHPNSDIPNSDIPNSEAAIHDVPITGEMIRLGQLLKLAGAVDNGADVRPLLADGLVTVNGEVELRRGRQLRRGDVITLDEISVRIS